MSRVLSGHWLRVGEKAKAGVVRFHLTLHGFSEEKEELVILIHQVNNSSPTEISFVEGIAEVYQLFGETVIFEENTKVKNIATLFERRHF